MNVTIANRVKTAVTLVVTAILAFVLYVSRDHITATAYMLGLKGYQAETLFVLIDIVALVGKVLCLKYFAKSTRAIGFKLMLAAGTLSLACNVLAGTNLGERLYGVFVVALFVTLEQVVVRIKPAASVAAAKTRAAKAAPVLTPAQRGAITRKANAAKKTTAVKTPKAPAAAPVSPATTAALEASYGMASAPVSGA